jgi:hypothetical protein
LVAYLPGESDSNTVGYSNCDVQSDAHCDAESNAKCNFNGDTKNYSHTKASSDAASETVMPG